MLLLNSFYVAVLILVYTVVFSGWRFYNCMIGLFFAGGVDIVLLTYHFKEAELIF